MMKITMFGTFNTLASIKVPFPPDPTRDQTDRHHRPRPTLTRDRALPFVYGIGVLSACLARCSLLSPFLDTDRRHISCVTLDMKTAASRFVHHLRVESDKAIYMDDQEDDLRFRNPLQAVAQKAGGKIDHRL
ncbi:unnamed protein product [Cyprideis torosa]|uniref:Uncharacterized protein n=1 Tax=Cyprideis torosa TaxID=163714 RepID=A0A7R8ZNN5_9CRUS|nr:unnamed protein product [Cyprideis torosa]CAG0892020.1 unnamed protein product [Cyprideis torosa]